MQVGKLLACHGNFLQMTSLNGRALRLLGMVEGSENHSEKDCADLCFIVPVRSVSYGKSFG